MIFSLFTSKKIVPTLFEYINLCMSLKIFGQLTHAWKQNANYIIGQLCPSVTFNEGQIRSIYSLSQMFSSFMVKDKSQRTVIG